LTRRTLYENIVDRFLLLYIISESSEIAPDFGKTKLQKLAFLSEWQMLDQRIKGLNYNFIKLVHGPYSSELDNDLTDFAKYDLVIDPWLNPTNRGYSILEDFSELVEQNEYFIMIINQIISRFARLSLKRILSYVYSRPHPYRKNLTIGQASMRTPLLYRIDENKAVNRFQITNEQLYDLALCLDKQSLKEWKEVDEEIRKGKFLTYREVFGVVEP